MVGWPVANETSYPWHRIIIDPWLINGCFMVDEWLMGFSYPLDYARHISLFLPAAWNEQLPPEPRFYFNTPLAPREQYNPWVLRRLTLSCSGSCRLQLIEFLGGLHNPCSRTCNYRFYRTKLQGYNLIGYTGTIFYQVLTLTCSPFPLLGW